MTTTRTVEVSMFEPLVLKEDNGIVELFTVGCGDDENLEFVTSLDFSESRELIKALQELIGDEPAAQQKPVYKAVREVRDTITGYEGPRVIVKHMKEVFDTVAHCQTHEDAERIAAALNK